MVHAITDASREREENTIALVKEKGLSYGQAAKRLGVTRSTVAGILYRAGQTKPQSQNTRPPKVSKRHRSETWHQIKVRHLQEKIDLVQERVDAGETMREASEKLGMSSVSLSEFCQRYGVKWTSPGELQRRKSEALVAYRRKLAKSGVTMKQAAEQAGVTVNAIRIFSLKHKIKWPKGEAK